MRNNPSDDKNQHSKRLPLSGNDIIFKFFFFVMIVFPIWLFLLLPLTLVYQAIYNLIQTSVVSKSKEPSSEAEVVQSETVNMNEVIEETKSNKRNRELDLVIIGATGLLYTFLIFRVKSLYKML